MVRGRRKNSEHTAHARQGLAQCVGAILLDLRNALRRAERCRRALSDLGYSRERWQEIVMDVDPELRFMVRPKMLDAIIIYLRSVGKPVSRNSLVHDLSAQAAGDLRRIRQSITANLHSKNLVMNADNKIGLPEWKNKKKK
ncbi:MAG TPA: hypothetical protein VGH51_03105 [Candidatus Angelobacter sp.]|jgi:hypothetical protein